MKTKISLPIIYLFLLFFYSCAIQMKVESNKTGNLPNDLKKVFI